MFPIFQRLKAFFCPPHKCKRYVWLLREGVKQCVVCGKKYNIRDGKLVDKPQRIHVDYK